MKNALIFSTSSSRYFAELIAEKLGAAKLGDIETLTFAGSEKYYRIGVDNKIDLMGKDVIFVGSTHTDEDLLEIIRVGSALAGYGAKRRIFVIPFLGYSTMERAVRPGEVVTAKVNARLLSSIPNSGLGNSFLMLDLHSAGIVHYFEGDCLRSELYAESVLADSIKSVGPKDFMFASADMGRPLWVQSFAKRFGTEVAFIKKSRNFEKTKVLNVIGDVRDKNVFIYDDMCRSGGTLLNAAEAYLNQGAKSVSAVISHLAFNDASIIKKLEKSLLTRIIGTNSHPMSQNSAVRKSKKFIVVDVSGVFAEAIRNILE